MIARLMERVQRRLHGAADRRAKDKGLRVRRTGWLNLGREYRDPRWTQRTLELGGA